MDTEKFRSVLRSNAIVWRKHALERMMQRGISRKDVKQAISNGVIIETYHDDKPFEGALFFRNDGQPLHAVVALDEDNAELHIITAYVPDNDHFEDDYKTRRQYEKE